MLRREIEDIRHYISNNLPINDILPSRILQSCKRNIIDTCTDITTLSMLVSLSPDILKALERDKKSNDKTKIDFLILSKAARLRQAELVYEKLRDKTDKKSIIKEIKDGFDEVGYPSSAKSAKLYVDSVAECLSQGFLPVSINTLRYDNDRSFQELLIISFSEKVANEERFEFQFKNHSTFKAPAINAFKSVKKLFSDEQSEILENLKIAIRLRDYPGGYIDKGYDERADSIGLAMAIAIFFNFHLYCASSDKQENMRRLFKKELSNGAFTGEINERGEIGSVGGLSQKIEAAEYMGLKMVFYPDANRNVVESESLSIVPVKSLEQTITLVRYGQYLEDAKKGEESMLPLIKERGFVEIVKKTPFDSMTGIAGVTKEIEIGCDIKQIDVLNMLDKGLLISGDGGIGKTTFLRYLRWHYSKRILTGESIDEFKGSIKIPIFIDLRSYGSEKKIPKLLRDSIIKECKDYKYLEENDIKYELESGRFLLLCDGIDKINKTALDEAQNELMNLKTNYPESYFVFSSRESADLAFLINFKRVELSNLKKEDIEKIINNAFAINDKRGSNLRALLTLHPLEIEGNPFFLSLIIEDMKNHTETNIDIGRFRNRGKLLERITAGRYEKDSASEEIPYTSAEKGLIEIFKRFMPGFAAWLWMEKRKTSFTKNDIAIYSNKTNKNSDDFIECLNNPKLIPLLELVSRNHWGFIHDRFFEYFAAVHLRDEFLKIVSETGRKPTPALIDYLQEYINMIRWEDIVLNTTGLLIDCEVKSGKIYCNCTQESIFCEKIENDPECQRSTDIQKTYPLSKR